MFMIAEAAGDKNNKCPCLVVPIGFILSKSIVLRAFGTLPGLVARHQ